MSFMRWSAAVLGAAVVAIALCGCGPHGVADGELTWSDDWVVNEDGSIPAFWEEPDRLVVILGGSSSCPSVVTEVEESQNLVRMRLERTGGLLCTADMVQTPTYFTLEKGRPKEVILTHAPGEYRLDVVDADR